MNKKGFTLVELIAVIVIIGVIALIAAINMGAIRNRVDLKTISGNFDLMLISARSYGESKITSLPLTVKPSELKDEGLDIGTDYNNIKISVFLNNRRADACILKNDSLDVLTSLVGESNLDYFDSYYCK